MKILSRSDEILLMAILRLKDNAYGVTIIKEVKRSTGRELKVGALWVALDILSKKGLIEKRMGDPTPQRGERRKIYYTLTPYGLNEKQIVSTGWSSLHPMMIHCRLTPTVPLALGRL
ncbi:MAG: helix-turn-helix transcriptional regulator [Candidatus Aminicenantes bacterium]|nr:helix-turn-helix transcriptional regulator [Candidatus Aminicenantes bacterium]